MRKKISMKKMLMLVVLLIGGIVFAKEPPGVKTDKRPLQRANGTPTSTLLNINRISSWYSDNGEQEREPGTGNSGFTYPRGTAQAIYSSGLIWGGIAEDGINSLARVNGSSYNNGNQRGRIKGIRTDSIESPDDPEVRIWRIRRDYATVDLKQDAAEFYIKPLISVSGGDIELIRKQYQKDWLKWPAEKGAPFYDRNNNGIYEPKIILDAKGNEVPDTSSASDQPGIADADQVIWFVANDIGAKESPWKSKPLGLEMQMTFWGYNRSDALGNIIFKKAKLIYKGTLASKTTSVINNMYLCQWSDPDLGDAGDDFAGCDTTLSIGFVYNSKTLDKEYRKFSIAPPASGFDFLQGPTVKTGVATDRAVFDLKYRFGSKNLPMTSFIYFASGGRYSDPPFSAIGAIQWYQMLRGLPPTPTGPPDPDPVTNPKTGQFTPFWLSGDAVAGTGWLDGSFDAPGDRRILLTSGPFNMALGDTQELVTAVLAGLGADRLSSISVLKFYDKTAQSAYDNLFDLPKPPISPKLNIVELDKGIVLEWESDAAAVKATETSLSKGFKFEGYNVYQLPSATAPLSNAKKLATYDLITDPSAISQDEFDEASGLVLVKPVQLGKNTGLTRYMYVTRDQIRNRPLVNGQPYYFAVTAFNYNGDPALVAHSFESSPNIVSATPHNANPGVVYPYTVNDSSYVRSTNVIGASDAGVGVVILNPTLQKGENYDVWYGGEGASDRNATIVRSISGTDYATVTATLRDTNEVPRLTTFATSKALGTFTINDAKTQISYSVVYENLSGVPAASSGIYIGAKGKNGTLVKTLTFTGNEAKGVWTKNDATQALADSTIQSFTAGNLYVNIMTVAKPTGEIRGQIADGVFRRANLPSPTTPGAIKPLPSIGTLPEIRLPELGFSFFLSGALLGSKTITQVIGGTEKNVVSVPSADGIFSIAGPISSTLGGLANEINIEIRFNNDVNYAITVPRGVKNPTPPMTSFIKVPFAVYKVPFADNKNKDTIRIWPVVVIDSATNPVTKAPLDTVWNVDPLNGTVNDKPVFDAIYAIVVDTIDDNSIKYYAPGPFPPTSNAVKGRLINGVNHIIGTVRFVNEKGDGRTPPASGTVIQFSPYKPVKIGDIKTFTVNALKVGDQAAAKTSVSKVNVFPNPYYAVNTSETTRERRFVTINHLPGRATIRIFNLAGTLVRTIEKHPDGTQFDNQLITWDLQNNNGLPVASGIYLLYIDMGTLGTTVLKAAIIMEQQFLQNY